jgi:RND family efflux transporter MFP subunit
MQCFGKFPGRFDSRSAFRILLIMTGAVILAILYTVSVPASALAETAPPAPAAPPPPAVTVAQPIAKKITEWDEYTGRFEAVDVVEVRARVSGYLNEVTLKEGEVVEKGSPLFSIDPRPFERVVERDRADLTQAQVRAEFSAREVERARPLLKNQTVSEQSFDQRQQAAREAEAQVKSAEAKLKSSELDLEFTHISAPLKGRIGRKLVSAGNYVNGGGTAQSTLLTTIVSEDPIQFYFDISESAYLKYARLGLMTSAKHIEKPQNPESAVVYLGLQNEADFPYKGRLDFTDNRIDQATGTLRLRAVFDNPKGIFTPGLFAHIRVAARIDAEALLLPDEAIGTDQSNRYVFTVGDNGIVAYKPVTLGPLIDGLRVIQTGVTSSDWVVVNGVQRARTGAPVTAKRASAEVEQKAPVR